MSECEDDVPRLLRDRRIKAVIDRFHREPTANELRAIDALPVASRKSLNDTSAIGNRIYDLLTAFEDGHVEALEEAGALLWERIFAKPDFSQRPRREPTSISKDLAKVATNANVEARQMARQKSTPQSPAEEVVSINATSNAFAGSPQKSWMTTGVSVLPSPRRVSSSSTERDGYSDTAGLDPQSVAPPIPFRLTQSGQQNQSHTPTFINQMPGSLPDIYNSGVYTPWPLLPISHERQYASPYRIQAPASSMSPVPERTDSGQTPMPDSNHNPRLGNDRIDYSPSVVNPHDPAKSHDFATLERNRSDSSSSPNSIPQHSAWGHPDSGMSSPGINYGYSTPRLVNQDASRPANHTVHPNHSTISSRAAYDPSTPPFHPAISRQAQQLFHSRKEEEEELARITSNIHHSLSKLPYNHGSQQATPSSTVYESSSSTMAAANTLANMPNTDRRTQHSSTHEGSSSAASSMVPGQSSNNPFVIKDGMGFIRPQDVTDLDSNPTPTNPLPITANSNSIYSSTISTDVAPNPNPTQPTTKKVRTPLPNGPLPQFGKLIPDKPVSGTNFSTNTKHDLLVSKAKKNKKATKVINPVPAFPQIDGAADPASYPIDTTDYARLPTKDLNVDLDVQASYMSYLPPQQELEDFALPSTSNATAFTFFDPYNEDDEDTYTNEPAYIPPPHLAHLPLPPHGFGLPPPPSPPPPHLRPHTPEYLPYPPPAERKKIWPPPPAPIEGYRQFTFCRDRISLNLWCKRRSEVDLDTGEYKYSMESEETSRGYKMDGTRIRTDPRFFRKKRKFNSKGRGKKVDQQGDKIDLAKKDDPPALHSAIRPEYDELFQQFHHTKQPGLQQQNTTESGPVEIEELVSKAD
ncbi:hypothetical protein NHQ30_001780 [Ciborinia camelliae]|nr:hypothetical protein NHQ30_001780 [Ciborinia camelliae]